MAPAASQGNGLIPSSVPERPRGSLEKELLEIVFSNNNKKVAPGSAALEADGKHLKRGEVDQD